MKIPKDKLVVIDKLQTLIGKFDIDQIFNDMNTLPSGQRASAYLQLLSLYDKALLNSSVIKKNEYGLNIDSSLNTISVNLVDGEIVSISNNNTILLEETQNDYLEYLDESDYYDSRITYVNDVEYFEKDVKKEAISRTISSRMVRKVREKEKFSLTHTKTQNRKNLRLIGKKYDNLLSKLSIQEEITIVNFI